MPIDPNIPLSFNPGGGGQQGGLGGSSGMFGILNNLMSFRHLQQQQQANDLLIRGRQEDLEDDDAVRGVFKRQNTEQPDWDAAMHELTAMGRGSAAYKLQDKIYEWGVQQVDIKKKAIDNSSALINLASKTAIGITDEASFKRALPNTNATLGKQLTQSTFGDTYDPKKVEQAILQGDGIKDHLAKQKQVFDEGRKLIEDSRNAMKDERDWADKQPELQNKWTNIASEYLSLSKNPKDWENGRKLVLDGMATAGLPLDLKRSVLSQFRPEFSKQAVEEARLLGMTQAERSQESRDNQRIGMEQRRLDDETAIDLTPEAKEILAAQFAKTGIMGPMGMGKKATTLRTEIYNRAGEIYKGLDLPSQVAAYQANKAALADRVKQMSNLRAYEGTSLKNLENFIIEAKRTVDSGSPLINRPLRTFTDQVLGSPQMAAFNTARQVVVPEFGRILTGGPNLTGVVSDSARGEVDALMKGEATLQQYLRVADILVKDVNNRTLSTDEEIRRIQDNIARPPVTANRSSQPSPNSEVTMEQDGKHYVYRTDAQGKPIPGSAREVPAPAGRGRGGAQ